MSDYTRKTPARGRMLKLAAALMVGTAASAISVTPAHAQVNLSSLRGTITNNGQPLATSEVTAIEVNTGYRRTVTTTADGVYNFSSLRPGVYKLEVQGPDGMRSTDQFQLTVAQNAQLDFDLSPAAGSADEGANAAQGAADEAGDSEIVVTGNKIRSLEGGEVGAIVSQRMIEQLPQNNRNFLAFADIAPGVQFITGENGNSRIQGGAQASNSVNVFIDGVGQKDYVLKNGVTGQDSTQGNPFPQLAVGEYRVISSNYKAEFDQVSSVAISAVTKSGTNEFHGEGFVDFTNQDLREKTPDEKFNDREKVKTKDFQFGGALGGPIIKDVAHFFVTYEGKRQQVPVDITPGLDLPVSYFPEEYQGYFGSTNRTFNEDLYFGKIDIVPTDADLFEFSVKYRDESGENLNSGQNASETRSLVDTEEWRGLGRWQHSADTWVNDFKVAYEDVHWAPQPANFATGTQFIYDGIDPVDGEGDVSGTLLRIGGGSNYQNKGQKGWTVSDDFTFTGVDHHTFKVGAKAKWVKLNAETLNGFNPLYSYNAAYTPDGGDFNDYLPYQVQFGAPTGNGDPAVTSKNFQLGLYAQDDWEVTDRLTVNIGLRWDYEETPSYLDFVTPDDAVEALTNWSNIQNTDYNINDYISTGNNREAFKGAFQPRLGFTYELNEEGNWAVFGGYGRSYDRTQFDFIQQELSTGSYSTRTFSFITGDPAENRGCSTPSSTCVAWDPVYLTQEGRDQLLAGAGSAGARELHLVNNDLKVPYSDQFSLGLRHSFRQYEAEIGYSHVSSHDGFAYLLGNRDEDGNFFIYNADTGAPGSPFGTDYSPPGFGSLLLGTNGIETRADSAYFKFTKNYTPSSPWSLNATYTYTQAEENRKFGEYFSLDFPNFGGADGYPFAPSAGVRKHRFVMVGSVDLPLDFALSGKFQIASPPYLTSLVSTGGDNPSRDVVSNEADGNGDRWGLRQLDLALTKYIPVHVLNDQSQLRLRVDVLNVFNDRNYVNYFDNPTNDNYLQRNGYSIGGNPPRTIKLTAGFSF